MSAEKAQENANPLSPFKGLFAGIRANLGMKPSDELLCGAKLKDKQQQPIRQKGGMEF